MLLGFTFSNFRSFRDEVNIRFTETRLDKNEGFPERIAEDGTIARILPVIAILGANASGKSNVLRALAFMRELVLNSGTRRRNERIEVPTFAFDRESRRKPTRMELDFVLHGIRNVYGFEIVEGRVRDEWLSVLPHKRNQMVFDRERGSEFQLGKSLSSHGARSLTEITRPESLFLSVGGQAEHPNLYPVYEFFERNLVSLDVPQRADATLPLIQRLLERQARALKLLSLADLGIVDAQVTNERGWDRDVVREAIMSHIPDGLPADEREAQFEALYDEVLSSSRTLELTHRGQQPGPLPFHEESLGTKSWLSFVSYALESLDKGGSLLVDELDASLHPMLMAEAIELFRTRDSNASRAQLLFTTHDVTMLGNWFDATQMPRGAIWFAEKQHDGSSLLTPLSDFRPRTGEDLARGYLQGRYGGVPRMAMRASEAAALSEATRRRTGQALETSRRTIAGRQDSTKRLISDPVHGDSGTHG